MSYENAPATKLERDGTDIIVRTPWSEQGVAMFRSLPHQARRFDKELAPKGAWRINASAERALRDGLRKAYQGAVASGPKGLFII